MPSTRLYVDLSHPSYATDMNIEEAREYCLTKKAATEGTPFGEDFLVYKVMGKMFACLDLNRPDRITLKCDADYALQLRDRYRAVEGAWHFNKKYWNQVLFEQDADDRLIRHLIDHSYEEVLKKFTRKMRQAYEALP